MDPSKPDSLFLRSTSAVSLHDRFSQVLLDQFARSRTVTFDPFLPLQRGASAAQQVFLLVKQEPSLQGPGVSPRGRLGLRRRRRKRRSVWTRLGWQQTTCRPRGFWSFTNKYRWRARFTSTCRRRGPLRSGLGQRRFRTNTQELTPGPHLRLNLPRGVASARRGRGHQRKDVVPTKKQLDEQLDDYMSMSRSRLDAELDEYMSMAGETQWD
ncbi:uncharacterized protein LOC108884726 isoform X1 [Lates japonicus]|uniref:Chromatin target of PRMT1 protein C-terminal domain-containing protein n=1 Tax=Lates japonicus TaxID=270547 RepID=A0AAD3NCH6_LATJO|nr:uncharacterized protein AKAME5_002003200 [Lates japonicus]